MLSSDRRRSPHAGRTLPGLWRWLCLAAVPFVVTACVTVTDDGGATESAAPATPTLDPRATPSPAAIVTPTPSPTPEPTPEPIDAEVFGFLPNWLVEEAAPALDSDLLTTVAFHGVEASGDGRLVSKKPNGGVPAGWKVLESEAFKELQAELQADDVDVVLVVQRFGWTDGTMRRTRNLLNDKTDRGRLADRIARFVEQRGLDGVNLDFEPMPQNLSGEYVQFVREVRAALDAVDPELALSVSVVSGLSGYDLAALTADDAADFAVIMGYNYRGEGAAAAGSVAPLSDAGGADLSASVEAALDQVSGDRIVLGLPWYGRAWSTESDATGARTISGRGVDVAADVPYAASVEFATQSGRRFDADQVSAWTAYPTRQCATCDPVWRQLWYDDADSFGAKVDYALGQDLAGVGIWALGHDGGREELWWTLRDRLRPAVDEAAPNGSASLDPSSILGELDGVDVVEGSARLQLFASDGPDGSGLVLTRIGLDGTLDEGGRLVTARTYPAAETIDLPLGDPDVGGSAASGPRTIFVQWRDIAGNWSTPLMLDVRVEEPATMPTPEDLR